MNSSSRTLFVALIAFVAALAGVFLGRALVPVRSAPGVELHDAA